MNTALGDVVIVVAPYLILATYLRVPTCFLLSVCYCTCTCDHHHPTLFRHVLAYEPATDATRRSSKSSHFTAPGGRNEPATWRLGTLIPDAHPPDMRTFLVAALVASASAFSGIAPAPAASKLSISKVAARTPLVEMQASSKATVIGAGAVGGIVGIYLTGELQSGLILGSVLAYASTTASQFGKYSENAGEAAVKVYDKTLELNAQYDLLPKVTLTLTPTPTLTPNPNPNPNPNPTPNPDPRSSAQGASYP